MKPEGKAIVILTSLGKYKCPNCNRKFQRKPRLNPRLKFYECRKCGSILELPK